MFKKVNYIGGFDSVQIGPNTATSEVDLNTKNVILPSKIYESEVLIASKNYEDKELFINKNFETRSMMANRNYEIQTIPIMQNQIRLQPLYR
jgi:hypothetical protein